MPRKRFTAATKRHQTRAAVTAAAARAHAVTAAPPAAAAAAPFAAPTPRGRRRRPRRQVAAVENIEGRVRNKRFKIKRLYLNLEILRLKKEVWLFAESS